MSVPSIAGHYVVDANVAIDATVPESLLSPSKDRKAYDAAFAFLGRARVHSANLFVPHLFFSEVANAISRDGVGAGLIGWEDAKDLLAAIFESSRWHPLAPEWARVLDYQARLGRTRSCGDSEYLALASMLGCELITGDARLAKAAAQRRLDVPVTLVTDHPWAADGGADAYPPNT